MRLKTKKICVILNIWIQRTPFSRADGLIIRSVVAWGEGEGTVHRGLVRLGRAAANDSMANESENNQKEQSDVFLGWITCEIDRFRKV